MRCSPICPAEFNGDGYEELTLPCFIAFGAVTQDNLDDLEQFTKEIRFASNTSNGPKLAAGAFYYDSSFNVTSMMVTMAQQRSFKCTTWALILTSVLCG